MAAPIPWAIRHTASICISVTRGLAASCTAIQSRSGSTASSPDFTESCLVAPPSTTLIGALWTRLSIILIAVFSSEAGTTTMISLTKGDLSKASRLQRRTGRPPRSRNCFGVFVPKRIPAPAATIIAETFIYNCPMKYLPRISVLPPPPLQVIDQKFQLVPDLT